jgi:hypothetical protein
VVAQCGELEPVLVAAAGGAANWRRNDPRRLARNACGGIARGAADVAADAPAAHAAAALHHPMRVERDAADLALVFSAALDLSSPPRPE